MDKITVNQALPVVLKYLELTSIAEFLSDDLATGMAIEDLVTRSLNRVNDTVNPPSKGDASE